MEIKRIPLKQINPAKYNPRKGLKPGDQPLIKKALSLDSDLVSQEVINALDKQPMTPLEHFQKALEATTAPVLIRAASSSSWTRAVMIRNMWMRNKIVLDKPLLLSPL